VLGSRVKPTWLGPLRRLRLLVARPERSNGAAPAGGVGYGSWWAPGDEAEARFVIAADADPERFERSGQADAERVGRLVGRDATVLDLGCGTGRVARYMAERCGLLWAVDASPVMLEMASRRLSGRPNVRLVRSQDTTAAEVPDHSVDVAYSILVLQHVEREDAFLLLRELWRVLKPSGRAYLTFPNLLSDAYLSIFVAGADARAVGNLARTRVYTPEEVARLLPAAGFSIEGFRADQDIVAVCRPAPSGCGSPLGGAGERTRTSIPEGTGT
jgi:SAM-dependent methyltransferase